MPDPFLLILALTAIALVILWPIREWRRRRYGRDEPEGDPTPLPPPERRNRG